MNKKGIKQTEWAKLFKKECPSCYKDAIAFAAIENLNVWLNYNNETGDWQWSIQVADTDFWLDSFDTKEQAEKLCEEMGWVIIC